MLTIGLLALLCLLDSPLQAEEVEPAVEADQEEIIQRILELRQQIEDLLEILPEDLRQEVEKRWREDQAGRPDEAPIGALPGPEPEIDPTLAERPSGEPATESELQPVREPEATLEVPADEPAATAVVPPCGGFHLLDTNEDSVVSGGDRQWRYLRLWFDDNGNGSLEEEEIDSLFELGVRQIDVGLRFYINDEDDSEDVDVDDHIWLRRVGKGSAKRRSGALAVDVDRFVRDGRFWLTDDDGVQLTGYQPLGPAVLLHTNDGVQFPLLCQESRGDDLN